MIWNSIKTISSPIINNYKPNSSNSNNNSNSHNKNSKNNKIIHINSKTQHKHTKNKYITKTLNLSNSINKKYISKHKIKTYSITSINSNNKSHISNNKKSTSLKISSKIINLYKTKNHQNGPIKSNHYKMIYKSYFKNSKTKNYS